MIVRGRTVYNNVLDIPEGKIGDYRVIHKQYPRGHRFPLVNARTAIMGGHRGEPVSFNRPTVWHELHESDGKWMTDYPIEQSQIDREVQDLQSGSVLVGGLGLGYVATVLAKRPSVTSVEVVEISREVIDLVGPHLCNDSAAAKAKISIVHANLFDHIKNLGGVSTYDHAYYDIWAGDGESTFFSTVLPLLQESERVVRGEPLCWNESVMRGQLVHSLDSRWRFALAIEQGTWEANPGIATLEVLCEYRDNLWTDWSVPFFRWARRVRPTDDSFVPGDGDGRRGFGAARQVRPPRESFTQMRNHYAGLYGRKGFAELWKELAGEDVVYSVWPRENT